MKIYYLESVTKKCDRKLLDLEVCIEENPTQDPSERSKEPIKKLGLLFLGGWDALNFLR